MLESRNVRISLYVPARKDTPLASSEQPYDRRCYTHSRNFTCPLPPVQHTRFGIVSPLTRLRRRPAAALSTASQRLHMSRLNHTHVNGGHTVEP